MTTVRLQDIVPGTCPKCGSTDFAQRNDGHYNASDRWYCGGCDTWIQFYSVDYSGMPTSAEAEA